MSDHRRTHLVFQVKKHGAELRISFTSSEDMWLFVKRLKPLLSAGLFLAGAGLGFMAHQTPAPRTQLRPSHQVVYEVPAPKSAKKAVITWR